LAFLCGLPHLNAITIKSKYPVPVIDEFLDELANASWFSCLDLRAGFHQIRLKPGEEFKTAFQTHFGQFEFRVMAFGLTGAPGFFQDAMNTTLQPVLRVFVLVFFDDILIYSKTYAEHIQHIKTVFELLQKDHWKVKLSKCKFAQRKISYLGFVISEQGVATDPGKVSAIVQWTTPTCAKELRSFLGLAGYYRKFVMGFGMISKLLTELLKKNTVFVWTPMHELSFSALKKAMSSAVLVVPNFSKPFYIETDACGTGVGAVLMQDGHPLDYISKALGPKSQGLSTYEKEYLAILLAQQWRAYLQHSEFTIFTDQKSLTQLTEQRLHTQWQQKVFTKQMGLQYRVVYKWGLDNRVADALSRKSSHDMVCAAVSSASLQHGYKRWCWL
jgi:ribonuclease HI